MKLIKKCKFVLDAPQVYRGLPIVITGCRKIKVRWLKYVTASTGNRDLTIKLKGIGLVQQGMFIKSNTSNDQYFFSMPSDDNIQTVLTYLNYTDEMDIDLSKELSPINELEFEILINDVLANDVTSDNPVTIELAFFE